MSKRKNIEALFKNKTRAHPKTYVIAEIGINHEGNVEKCAAMIRSFAEAGADAIKLQTVDAKRSYAKDTKSYEVFSKASLTRDETSKMFDLAREYGVDPFTTSGDLETLEWIDKLNPVAHKISSGLLSCLPIVDVVCSLKKPVIMSTGMSGQKTITKAVSISKKYPVDVALLQCTSVYPCPIEKLELSAIREMNKKYKLPVGFSDHSVGIDMAPLAVAAGAKLIEKHVTFDKEREGFDHFISLNQSEFVAMIKQIRTAEVALGGKKNKDERSKPSHFERRLAATRDLDAGHVLSVSDLLFLRFSPNTEAILAEDTHDVIGKTLATPVAAGESISWQKII